MAATTKPLQALTAGDLMTTTLVRLTEDMPLRRAGRLMLDLQVTGAPVVDARGRCVGILSATDFLRLAVTRDHAAGSLSDPRPATCSFQEKRTTTDGHEETLCTLPSGTCPIQVQTTGPYGDVAVVCGQPHSVLADWQVVETEKIPPEPVRRYMTADPVTVTPSTPVDVVARKMIDAHIHRVIVVDGGGTPLGIVSATDILAAVARPAAGR
jgi:CBS domain-containing protein